MGIGELAPSGTAFLAAFREATPPDEAVSLLIGPATTPIAYKAAANGHAPVVLDITGDGLNDIVTANGNSLSVLVRKTPVSGPTNPPPHTDPAPLDHRLRIPLIMR